MHPKQCIRFLVCVARSANIFYKGVADLIAISGVESRVELLISETNGFRF